MLVPLGHAGNESEAKARGVRGATPFTCLQRLEIFLEATGRDPDGVAGLGASGSRHETAPDTSDGGVFLALIIAPGAAIVPMLISGPLHCAPLATNMRECLVSD